MVILKGIHFRTRFILYTTICLNNSTFPSCHLIIYIYIILKTKNQFNYFYEFLLQPHFQAHQVRQLADQEYLVVIYLLVFQSFPSILLSYYKHVIKINLPSLSVSSSPNGLKSLLASESSLCSSLISDSDSDILKSESSLSDFESESLESLARFTCLEDACRPNYGNKILIINYIIPDFLFSPFPLEPLGVFLFYCGLVQENVFQLKTWIQNQLTLHHLFQVVQEFGLHQIYLATSTACLTLAAIHKYLKNLNSGDNGTSSILKDTP
ncbi:hypothetical protein AGLY_001980 [Aphis glycines]|uniref:Uncharacterized protein n=1 Tax=Aphis glycines TaxID=307491 RepID=A0A6G0U6K4_APHGL|nr:hypothetical protein AGLY_001980 [Aphis glycines]